MSSKFLVIAISAMIGWAGAAHANLVQDGGFETIQNTPNDFTGTGWTVSSNANIGQSNAPALDGNFSAQLGDPSGSPGKLSQTLATTIGTTYTISFLLANLDTTQQTNSFSVSFDGKTLTNADLPASNVPGNDPTSPQLESFIATASSISALLVFTETNDNSNWILDDVSVDPVGVPEPSTLALIGGGLLACFAMSVRRNRARRE